MRMSGKLGVNAGKSDAVLTTCAKENTTWHIRGLLITKCWVQAHSTCSLDINADRIRAVAQVEQKSVTEQKIDSSISANDIFEHGLYTA